MNHHTHAVEIAPRVLSWASQMDDNTVEQAARTARLPIIHDHIALMPDAHLGFGATVGSVIATEGAIIPAAVGVDIGCGMIAANIGVTASQLPDSLDTVLDGVAHAIPAGVGRGNEVHDRGTAWIADNPPASELSQKELHNAVRQFGSLGSGNHFLELCTDEDDDVWLMLHSGSRGIGNRLAQRHIDGARKLTFEHPLEDRDLAYVTQGTPEFDAYIGDMLWAQAYAAANRAAMLDAALAVVAHAFDRPIVPGEVVNIHHNYAALEHHDGRDLWITRKGATSAKASELGIIPGSMATGSFIVRGLGNPASFQSCSHGAGRRLSRTKARKTLTPESLVARMEGKAWQRADAHELVDEHPDAYKDLSTVMADQADLVEPVHRLTAVLNYKGVR
jgi:tRNA-splicing ligase RtcB